MLNSQIFSETGKKSKLVLNHNADQLYLLTEQSNTSEAMSGTAKLSPALGLAI